MVSTVPKYHLSRVVGEILTHLRCETENPLWGLTTNPLNPAFTPGGSTGGESALLAQHGSLVGWGTDIGGSVRIPSHMLGLYALKPSVSANLIRYLSFAEHR